MAKSTYNYFQGIAHYVRGKTPDAYGKYSVNIEFTDPEELKKFKDSGIQVELSPDNKTWFRRPDQKMIKNEMVTLGPPRIVDKDGNDLDVWVGAGSEVVVKVRSYNTMKGVGHTLDAIQVLNLVEVSGSGEYRNF